MNKKSTPKLRHSLVQECEYSCIVDDIVTQKIKKDGFEHWFLQFSSSHCHSLIHDGCNSVKMGATTSPSIIFRSICIISLQLFELAMSFWNHFRNWARNFDQSIKRWSCTCFEKCTMYLLSLLKSILTESEEMQDWKYHNIKRNATSNSCAITTTIHNSSGKVTRTTSHRLVSVKEKESGINETIRGKKGFRPKPTL